MECLLDEYTDLYAKQMSTSTIVIVYCYDLHNSQRTWIIAKYNNSTFLFAFKFGILRNHPIPWKPLKSINQKYTQIFNIKISIIYSHK